jgi:diguanylate cyclase (GGDEF)-like protein
MDHTDSAVADTPAAQMGRIRHTLVDRMWQGLFVVALLGAPASASRSLVTGWRHLYTFHIAVAFLIVAVYWFRARIPFAVKSALLPLIFWGVGLAGVFAMGMLGAGYWWLVLSSLLVSMLYSMRAGIAVAVAVTLLLGVAGAGYVSGVLKVAVDANVYMASPATWATLLIAAIVTPFIVFQSVAAYQETTLELLEEVHKQRDHIHQLATHDQLTGLPLMRLAGDRLQMALYAASRSGKKVALLFIDLDGFKNVNDTWGHEAGDYVLKEVANRLLKSIRAEDTAARIGGDEFIVILGGLPDEQVAARIAGRTISTVSRPISHAGGSTSVGVSIGIGLFPDHAADAPALQRAADAAMYTAKRSGGNRFVFAERA